MEVPFHKHRVPTGDNAEFDSETLNKQAQTTSNVVAGSPVYEHEIDESESCDLPGRKIKAKKKTVSNAAGQPHKTSRSQNRRAKVADTGISGEDIVEDEEYVVELFDEELDPFTLLSRLEEQHGKDEEHGAGTAYKLVSGQVRRKLERAAANEEAVDAVEREDGTVEEDGDAATEEEEAGPSTRSGRRFRPTAGAKRKEKTKKDGTGDGAAGKGGQRRRRGRPPKRRDVTTEESDGWNMEDMWDSDELAEMLDIPGVPKAVRNRFKKRRGRPPRSGVVRAVPEEVSKKLGEAHVNFISGNFREAIPLLREVISSAPNLAEPYLTLGQIYESLGDKLKALDLTMIAAHLTAKDVSTWKRLATWSAEAGHVRQAIYCLSKVIRIDKQDVDSRFDRALLYATIQDHRRAAIELERLLQLHPDDAEVPAMLARVYHQLREPHKAIQTLKKCINNKRHLEVDMTHVHYLVELYMEGQQYDEALQLLRDVERNEYGPQGLPTELQVRAGLCCLRLGDSTSAEAYFQILLRVVSGDYSDLHIEVGDAFKAVGQHDRALAFYNRVLESPEAGPDLWIKAAACLKAMGNMAAAVKLFNNALGAGGDDIVGQVEGCISLAELYVDMNSEDEAMQVLDALSDLLDQQDVPVPVDEATMLNIQMARSSLLLKLGKEDAFLEVMLPVVTSTLHMFQHTFSEASSQDPEVTAALKRWNRRMAERHKRMAATGQLVTGNHLFKGYTSLDRRKESCKKKDAAAQAVLEATGMVNSEGMETDGPFIDPSAPYFADILKDDAQFHCMVRAARVLCQQGQLAHAKQLADTALKLFGSRWLERSKRDVLRMVFVEVSMKEDNHKEAFANLRPVLNRWPHSTQAWNAYCRLVAAEGGLGHNSKFLGPARSRCPSSLPLMLLLGHCFTLQGYHSDALSEFFHAWRMAPQEPLVLLLLGVGFANQAMSRKVPDRHHAVLYMLAFLHEYSAVRGNPQESYYNTARAAHQLGLNHMAVVYYNKALEVEPPPLPSGLPPTPGCLSPIDVRREAAHNLAQIYKSNGAKDLAKKILRKYCTV